MATTLQKQIRDAKENGTRWTPKQIKNAEDRAERMFDDSEYRDAILSALVERESKSAPMHELSEGEFLSAVEDILS